MSSCMQGRAWLDKESDRNDEEGTEQHQNVSITMLFVPCLHRTLPLPDSQGLLQHQQAQALVFVSWACQVNGCSLLQDTEEYPVSIRSQQHSSEEL